MKFDMNCESCRAELEVEVILEPAGAVEAGGDPLRTEVAEDVTARCPQCGKRIETTLPPGIENFEVRLRG
jgi:uncharacterized Zn finger protein